MMQTPIFDFNGEADLNANKVSIFIFEEFYVSKVLIMVLCDQSPFLTR